MRQTTTSGSLACSQRQPQLLHTQSFTAQQKRADFRRCRACDLGGASDLPSVNVSQLSWDSSAVCEKDSQFHPICLLQDDGDDDDECVFGDDDFPA